MSTPSVLAGQFATWERALRARDTSAELVSLTLAAAAAAGCDPLEQVAAAIRALEATQAANVAALYRFAEQVGSAPPDVSDT